MKAFCIRECLYNFMIEEFRYWIKPGAGEKGSHTDMVLKMQFTVMLT